MTYRERTWTKTENADLNIEHSTSQVEISKRVIIESDESHRLNYTLLLRNWAVTYNREKLIEPMLDRKTDLRGHSGVVQIAKKSR